METMTQRGEPLTFLAAVVSSVTGPGPCIHWPFNVFVYEPPCGRAPLRLMLQLPEAEQDAPKGPKRDRPERRKAKVDPAPEIPAQPADTSWLTLERVAG